MRKLGVVLVACLLGVTLNVAQADDANSSSGQTTAGAAASTSKEPAKPMTEAEKKAAAQELIKSMEGKAEIQLAALFKESIKRPVDALAKDGKTMPSAAMMFVNGHVKEVDIKQKDVPAGARVEIYRAALRAAARHHTIVAAIIYYTAEAPDKDGKKQKYLVAEYEHLLGVSAMRIIPYKFKDGKVAFGKPIDRKKPYVMFYDPQKGSLDKNGEAVTGKQ